MFLQVAGLAGILLGGLVTIGIVFVLGMRTKSPIVQGALIWLTRTVFNPRQLRSAGQPGAYASVIQHRGRRSGRSYATPVGAVATDDGFVVTLPYGSRPHWLRNVLASGSATLVHEGATYAVERPELVPMSSLEHVFSPADQRSHRLFAMDTCVRLHEAGPPPPDPERPDCG